MKLRYTFLLTFLLITGGAFPYLKAQPQPKPAERLVTVRAKAMRLEDFFTIIQEQTQLQAFYDNAEVNIEERIDVNFEQEPLDNVLTSLFREKGLNWKFLDEVYLLWPKKPGDPDLGELPGGTLVNVTGLVTDKNGMPLKNTSVIVRGTRKGTRSDSAGVFSLSGIQKKASLLVSCLGYSPKYLRVKNTDTLQVALDETVTGLDEVVVIAYGTSTRRNLTGAISRVTAADIATQSVNNPLLAMEGRVPGLNITQLSGLPGGEVKVELRGRNSIAAGNNPLYIVDGVPFPATALTFNNVLPAGVTISPLGASNPLNMLNIADIESIEVLKDADATAIYGSRGANGVMLISTKAGKEGKLKMDINLQTGIGKMAHGLTYLNTQQYLEMRKEAFKNDGADPHVNDNDLLRWDTASYTNWEKRMLGGTALIRDGQIAISGGNNMVQCRATGGYRRETTAYPGQFSYQKMSGRIYFALLTPDRKGKAVITTSYVADRNILPPTDLAAFAGMPPNTPRDYNPDGTLNWASNSYDNPMGSLLRPYKASTSSLMATSVLSYEILRGLQVRTSLGFNNIQMDEKQVNPWRSFNPYYGYGSTIGGFSNFASGSIRNWIMEPQAEYQAHLNIGQFSVLIGTSFQQDVRDQKGYYATDFGDDDQLENMTAASRIDPLGVSYYRYRYSAIFGRFNYNWQGKYIIQLTGRRDGSSRFGPGRQFATFGAIGTAWIFSAEKWAQQYLPFLSFGKIRASYGTTGNDQIADYAHRSAYRTFLVYDGQLTRQPARLSNPVYGWETNKKLETSLELGFARDRILVRASYYRNYSSNQLINYSLPGLSGFSSILSNFAALVKNSGVELELNTVNIKSRHLRWNSSFNISIPNNKLISFPGIENTPYDRSLSVGQPLDIFKGLHYSGVNPANGAYEFTGVDKDGKLAPGALTFTKRTGAFFYGGLQNSLQYSGWQLDVLLQFVRQNRYNYLLQGEAPGMALANQPAAVLERWQMPGDQSGIQRFTQGPGSAYWSYLNARRSDATIADASFIRLKSLSLGYQLPDKWMRRAHLQSARFYLQGQNLLTLTRYKGRDPEVAAAHDVYPPLRTWTLGLQLGL